MAKSKSKPWRDYLLTLQVGLHTHMHCYVRTDKGPEDEIVRKSMSALCVEAEKYFGKFPMIILQTELTGGGTPDDVRDLLCSRFPEVNAAMAKMKGHHCSIFALPDDDPADKFLMALH